MGTIWLIRRRGVTSVFSLNNYGFYKDRLLRWLLRRFGLWLISIGWRLGGDHLVRTKRATVTGAIVAESDWLFYDRHVAIKSI